MFLKLSDSTRDIELIGYSLFAYDPITRHTILTAKVKGEYPALKTIKQHLMNCEIFLPSYVLSIVPAPSSLKSKWMGRVDVAYAMAEVLAARFARDIKLPPWRSQFRWKKQTSLEQRPLFRMQRIVAQGYEAADDGEATLLFVDDVMTSGDTLLRLAEQLGVRRGLFLTYAQAMSMCASLVHAK